jgi:hypothetical protein
MAVDCPFFFFFFFFSLYLYLSLSLSEPTPPQGLLLLAAGDYRAISL